MSYHNVVHVGHQRGYPSEYPPGPQQPGFPGPPPPPQLLQQQHQRYQDYFYEGYPPPHSAHPYNRHHYQNNDSIGCDSFVRTCLGSLCCCWIFERCCLWY
ncbi:protein CYSTEINE-RICH TRANSMEMBRANE MODULE 7-like [Argentina anserina]|uniref:protein CYSTEINE-RICH TRANSMEMBRANE MODULE 7-like n=1 Tax=Argentina anserina TaxID=57926 RepID=UPI0021761D68|nr:protein CYSTEINE-RICH TRANSMEMBRANE MODULE 7-like [Potentilla anserina]